MTIDLYLTKINQDIIGGGVSGAKRPRREWIVSWPKSCCIFGALADTAGVAKTKRGYLLREEKEGGMVYDPRTAAVYKVDEEAYHTLIEMERTTDLKLVASRLGIGLKAVKGFQKRLEELSLA